MRPKSINFVHRQKERVGLQHIARTGLITIKNALESALHSFQCARLLGVPVLVRTNMQFISSLQPRTLERWKGTSQWMERRQTGLSTARRQACPHENTARRSKTSEGAPAPRRLQRFWAVRVQAPNICIATYDAPLLDAKRHPQQPHTVVSSPHT